ncbi:MAG: DUF2807 domain-containing protein [Bacteroidia bacterium]
MKRNILILLAAIWLPLFLSAQVNGNRKMITDIRSTGVFSGVKVNFPAEVEIVCQTIPHLEITVDENILPWIEVKMEGAMLHILQGKWIEPSQPVRIVIGTAFLHRLETGGYGEYWVKNIDAPVFTLVNPVGTVQLEGRTDRLIATVNTGRVDASQLNASEADITVTSYGSVQVRAKEVLRAQVADNGKVVYVEKPGNIYGTGPIVSAENENPPAVMKPRYIQVTLVNNSPSKIDMIIQGPPGHRFSYGAPLRAGQRRTEEVPLGTRIYLDQIIIRKLLVTISETDENQVVKLFEN